MFPVGLHLWTTALLPAMGLMLGGAGYLQGPQEIRGISCLQDDSLWECGREGLSYPTHPPQTAGENVIQRLTPGV